jgi:hypothetical protein
VVRPSSRCPITMPTLDHGAARAALAPGDYFQVEDDSGERFWIYRAGDGEDAATGSYRWFLHGIFG